MKRFTPPLVIRKELVKRLSQMYEKEVPLYSETLPVVKQLNNNEEVKVCHGAIRIASGEEMSGLSKVFRVMNMFGVNYYNLSPVGLPVHSTAFRPLTTTEMSECPFRVFCSLLRKDLVPSNLRPHVEESIKKRQIVTPKLALLALTNLVDGGLTDNQSEDFVEEALKTFARREDAIVPKSVYEEMLKTNSLLADVSAFQNPHINHLTPQIKDIDKLFSEFRARGIATIPIIQGPPKRKVPILLRQMSFQAVVEKFNFPDGKGGFEVGQHRARFGEYETKDDAAVTPKGRALYDKLLSRVHERTKDTNPDYYDVLHEEFSKFPDELETLRKEGLIYVHYTPTEKGLQAKSSIASNTSIDDLVSSGYVQYSTIPYHDFLPVSATGIFKSNLVEGGMIATDQTADRPDEIEGYVGYKLHDSMKMCEAEEKMSIQKTLNELGMK